MIWRSALITGGAGFIGTHLAQHLTQLGVGRIFSIDIAQPARPVKGVIYLRHDVREPFGRSFDQPVDIVFNLAAIHRTPGHEEREYFNTNVAGATNVIGYCERHGVPQMLFTSSISVYGPSEAPVDETSLLAPNTAYGFSKRLAEVLHTEWQSRSTKRRLVIVRPAVVFGTGENGNYTKLARALKNGMFAFPGRSDTRKACGYVKELIRSMMFALESAEPSYLYNFAGQRCATIGEICSAFLAVSDVTPPRGTLPRSLMVAAAQLCEIGSSLGIKTGIDRARLAKLWHSTNVVPARLIADGYDFAYTLESSFVDWLSSDDELGIAVTASAQPQSEWAAPEAREQSALRKTG
jgi:GlcNAc-P-P-Und epimerase